MSVRQKLLIAGGFAGALVGVIAAFLYIKANEGQVAAVEAGKAKQVGDVSPGEAISVVLSLLGMLRLISELGRKTK